MAVKVLETRGQYSNVKVYSSSPDTEKAGWKSGAFTANTTNQFIASFIYCKVAPGYGVNIRATAGKPENEPLQSLIKRLQEIADAPKKP